MVIGKRYLKPFESLVYVGRTTISIAHLSCFVSFGFLKNHEILELGAECSLTVLPVMMLRRIRPRSALKTNM